MGGLSERVAMQAASPPPKQRHTPAKKRTAGCAFWPWRAHKKKQKTDQQTHIVSPISRRQQVAGKHEAHVEPLLQRERRRCVVCGRRRNARKRRVERALAVRRATGKARPAVGGERTFWFFKGGGE